MFTAAMRDVVLEAMLLPRVRRVTGSDLKSWSSEVHRPARIRSVTYANAVFIAALLRAAARSAADANHWSVFTESLLRSDFGDPRVPPESPGWTEVKRVDRTSYDMFLEALISEDLEIFFAHAMQDPRRRQFWLRYLKSVRRTVCILDNVTHERLSRQFAGADKKMSAALSRARRFAKRGRTAIPQAFCLYFDTCVVVEFSQTGNAAFIYSRDDFERTFERDVRIGALEGPEDLKHQSLRLERIIHQGPNWEQNADEKLHRLGIQRGR
jgi:hypothetical protein